MEDRNFVPLLVKNPSNMRTDKFRSPYYQDPHDAILGALAAFANCAHGRLPLASNQRLQVLRIACAFYGDMR